MTRARELRERDVRQALRFLERALARDRRQGCGDVNQTFPVVVLRELLRGVLEVVEATLFGELRCQVAQQRAPVVATTRVAQALGQLLRQLEIVRHDRPRARQRIQPGGVLAHALVRLDQQPGGRLRLHQRQRAFGDGRERLPLLGRQHLVAQGEQRLLRAFDFTVQRAHRREQVVDTPRCGGCGLLQAAAELVPHPRQPLLLLGVVGECLQFRAC